MMSGSAVFTFDGSEDSLSPKNLTIDIGRRLASGWFAVLLGLPFIRACGTFSPFILVALLAFRV